MHGWTNAVAVGDGAFGVGRCGAWFVSKTNKSYIPVSNAANSELLCASYAAPSGNAAYFIEDLGASNGTRLLTVDVDSRDYSSTLLRGESRLSSFKYLSIPVFLAESDKGELKLLGEDGTVYDVNR